MQGKSGILPALFGAVFFTVGAGMGYFQMLSMHRAESMLQWRACEAKLLSCELKRHRGSKGGVSYSVHAQYEYEVKGVTYKNDRVGLSSGADNIGTFHRDTYRKFKKHRNQGKPIVCWINPENTADSILFRKPRIPLLLFKALFVLIFGSVGLGIALVGMFKALTPDMSSDNSWQPRIPMRGLSVHKVVVAIAIYWNVFTLWMSWKALVVFTITEIPLYFWLLPSSGIIPALIAAYVVVRFNKYGLSVFEMSPLPGVLGGPVTGNIMVPKPVVAEAGFDLTLQCIHQYTTRSGKSSTTHRDVIWDDCRHIDTGYNNGVAMVLPVKFAVPYHKPATTTAGNSNGHYWQLKVKANTPGIDYKAVFDLPVKHTPQSVESPQDQHGLNGMVQNSAAPSLTELASSMNLVHTRSGEGVVEIGFPAFRAQRAAAWLCLVTLVWSGACWLIVRSKAPWLFAAVFIFFDLMFLLTLPGLVFAATVIRIDPHCRKLSLFKAFAGITYKTREFAFEELDFLKHERGMQSGPTCYYRISARLIEGKTVTLGSMIESRSGAQRLAAELTQLFKTR